MISIVSSIKIMDLFFLIRRKSIKQIIILQAQYSLIMTNLMK